MTLQLLCIADLHGYSPEKIASIQKLTYDVCLLLGDIPHEALLAIREANGSRPIYGICGNHDDWQSLERAGIPDIHCKSIQAGEYTIAGFGGSHRYKSGDCAMMTQKESLLFIKQCPAADILISHDGPYKLFGNDVTHLGLQGLSRYISKKKPRYHFCGHYHRNMTAVFHKCHVQCIYGFQILTIPDKEMHYE